MWRLQLGPPKNFQPIRDCPFNKELGARTLSETVLFFDWLVSILNFSPFRMAYFQHQPIRDQWILFSLFQWSYFNFYLFNTCVAFLKVKVEIISVQLRIVVLTITVEIFYNLCAKGFQISIILGNRQPAIAHELGTEGKLKKYRVQMKCHTTAQSIPSLPAIKHLAHSLFLISPGMQEKMLFYSTQEV